LGSGNGTLVIRVARQSISLSPSPFIFSLLKDLLFLFMCAFPPALLFFFFLDRIEFIQGMGRGVERLVEAEKGRERSRGRPCTHGERGERKSERAGTGRQEQEQEDPHSYFMKSYLLLMVCDGYLEILMLMKTM
jgi:hypothetical protein